MSENQKSSPFDYVRAIRTKKGTWSDFDSKQYIPYIVNRALSFDMQSLFHANEMNKQTVLPHKAQFEFYLNSVSKLSGYSPWIKAEKVENIQYVKSFYDVSTEKAKEILNLLSEDQVDYIKTKVMQKDTKNE